MHREDLARVELTREHTTQRRWALIKGLGEMKIKKEPPRAARRPKATANKKKAL